MGNERFDAMVDALARARSRREMLAAIGVGAAGAAAMEVAVGAQSNGCQGAGGGCKRDGQCCSGRCRKRRGKKRGRCRCSTLEERCLVTSDCCDAGDELVCDMGGCVPAAQD